jgi:hypothetical protein
VVLQPGFQPGDEADSRVPRNPLNPSHSNPFVTNLSRHDAPKNPRTVSAT